MVKGDSGVQENKSFDCFSLVFREILLRLERKHENVRTDYS